METKVRQLEIIEAAGEILTESGKMAYDPCCKIG